MNTLYQEQQALLRRQLAGATHHAHTMLGERYRSYFDVVTWMTHEGIITAPEAGESFSYSAAKHLS